LDRTPLENTVYKLLHAVVVGKAYSQIALDKEFRAGAYDSNARSYITKLFYGVLDKSIQFDWIIGKAVQTPPQENVSIILKTGLYLLRHMRTPSYAAVDKTVELCKTVTQNSKIAGFVNAVLKKTASVSLPPVTDAESLAINASYPLWLAKKLIDRFGFDFTREYLLFVPSPLTHIRHNGIRLTREEFEQKYPQITQNKGEYGYYAAHNTIRSLKNSDYVVQSAASVRAVRAYFEPSAKKVLDLCAAPGGKAVYLYELYKTAGLPVKITACDVHPHRVGLIKKYAYSAGANLTVMQSDAGVFRPEWERAFDSVVCDAPCSGLGVVSKKPEILLTLAPADIASLTALQSVILSTAARYVKPGGSLCYSTCTVTEEENEGITDGFLRANPGFEYAGKPVTLFPHTDGCDGFYIAKLKRVRGD
jgi:16S rRNA (cytosine967-C5)-methyltransferase